MRKLLVTAVFILATGSGVSRADFVLDAFNVNGDTNEGTIDIGNGINRTFFKQGASLLFVENNELRLKVRGGLNVRALYELSSSLDIAGMSLLRFGLDLTQTDSGTDDWTIDVTLSDGTNSETASLNISNPVNGPFGIDLSSISASIRQAVQSIEIKWTFNGPYVPGDGLFGTGRGGLGLVFTPEPGSLLLLGGASVAGLVILRRRRQRPAAA